MPTLLSGYQWPMTHLTYAFPDSYSDFSPDYSSSTGWNFSKGFSSFSQSQKTLALQVLQEVSSFTGLTFDLGTDSGANLRFSISSVVEDMGFDGYAYYPNQVPMGGDVWLRSSGINDKYLMTHEIGHALGLQHYHSETTDKTVMSYTFGDILPQGFMTLDIQALQGLYGQNLNYKSGNNIYSFSPSGSLMKTIWDSGGKDTFDFSSFTKKVFVDLNEGQESLLPNGSVYVAFGCFIENAIGTSKADTFIGNPLNNKFTGGRGRDTFVFEGDFGDDKILDFEAKDRIQLSGNYDILFKNNGTLIETDEGSVLLKGYFGEIDFL